MQSIAPTLELFDRVVEELAGDPRTAAHSPEWIRSAAVLGGEKAKIVRYIWRNVSTNGNPPRVLDVGAQIGAFALFAARTGCRVSAVDYDFFTNIYSGVLAEHGIDYRACDLSNQPLPFPDRSFDVVTYSDVIEHHSFSPKRVLREIHRVLDDAGLVMISTPNHASIYNRITLLSGRTVNDNFTQYFDRAADQPTYLGHHREYTRAELRYALEQTGFRVRECRVVEEDLRALLHFWRRRSSGGDVRLDARNLIPRVLGLAWSTLRLPFGRVLWGIGQKIPK